MRNFQGNVFIGTWTYSEIFKPALVYLQANNAFHGKKYIADVSTCSGMEDYICWVYSNTRIQHENI